MADAKKSGGGGGGGSDILIFLGAIALLVLFWFINGGMKSLGKQSSFLIQSPLATSSNHVWLPFLTPAQQHFPAAQTSGAAGSAQGGTWSSGDGVTISDYSGARASDPQQEYIEIYANQTNTGSVVLSGMQLKSVATGHTATIGGGTQTAYIGQATSPAAISLMPGESAIISTGRSPVGISFRENECTGYLSQFQTFTPRLASNCPFPQTELQSRSDLANDPLCTQAVAQITACQTVLSAPSAPAACAQFITNDLTYNGCATAHHADPNFSSPTSPWRIYLGLGSELWSNTGDTIELLDDHGAVVTSVKY